MLTVDGIIIGGGHNGLVCAAYLARAGIKIAVVERNAEIGGGCTTQEVTLPGFRHNLHSNFHFFEEGPAARDLELERYGLRYIYPEVQHGMAFRDGTAVCIHLDPLKTAASFARFSRRDADRYLELHDKFAVQARDLINQFLYSRPLPPAELAARIKGPLGEEFLSYGRLSLYEAVDQNFEDEHVRCIFKAFLHSISLENLPGLGSFFPRLLSRVPRLGLAEGGAIALPRALARVIEAHGGSILTGAHAEAIEVEGGRAVGVRLADGSVVRAARFVASGVDAPQTMRMAGDAVDAELRKKVEGFQWARTSLVTLHLALNEPPRYAAAAFDPDIDRAFDLTFGADHSREIQEGFDTIIRGELPARLTGNGACNTLFDPSMAPSGKHTAFWWPFAPYAFRDGGADAWDRQKKEISSRILEEWRGYAPNLTADNVLGTFLFTPVDIERSCINMVRGSHHGGAYLPSQLGAARPTPELSQFRTPIEGLYLCGASSHSGGSITGSPGYNCANTVSEDLSIPRFWTPIPSPRWDG